MRVIHLNAREQSLDGKYDGATKVLVLCDCTDGAISTTLPDAKSCGVDEFVFVKTDSSSNAVTVSPATYQTIGASSSKSISSQDQAVRLINGLNGFYQTSEIDTGITGSGTLNSLLKWTPDGVTAGDSIIREVAAKIGVGTSSPSGKLQVSWSTVANAHYPGNIISNNDYPVIIAEAEEGRIQIVAEDEQTEGATLILTNAPTVGNNKHWVLAHRGPTTNSNRLDIGYYETVATDWNMQNVVANISIKKTGEVGIGYTTQFAKLAINGGLHVGGVSDPGGKSVQVSRGNDGVVFRGFGSSDSATRGNIYVDHYRTFAAFYGYGTINYCQTRLGSATTDCIVIDGENSRIGIGMVPVSEKLEVNGNVIIGSGTAGVDYALTFDGETNDGVITWMEYEDYFKFDDDMMLADGKNLIADTTTGSKIGTSSSQKLGFWNATPVVQPSHIADPSGGATVDSEARTAITSILSALETAGILAAS